MKTEKMSPWLIFASLLLVIFCAEEGLTFALDVLLPADFSHFARASIDAGALTLLMSLFIWWLVMQPLRLALVNESAMAKAVADATADAIVTTDEHGTIESVNPAAVTMFGYAATEVLGNNVAMLMYESHAGEYLDYIAEHLRKNALNPGKLSREFWARRKDRGVFPIELSMAVTTLGGVRRFTSIVHDITEHKRMEQALRASAAELRLIIDTVPGMIVYYDTALRCRFANKRFADFFGLDANSVAGAHLRQIVGDASYAVAEGELLKAFAGQALTYERTQLCRNGESVPLEVRLVPHLDDKGTPLGAYGLLMDITAHKAAEESIRRLTKYDSVTGLADRTLFMHQLGQEIAVARRQQKGVAVIYLSLGKFKYVNDTLGHRAGDQLLAVAAERVRYQARRNDTVARVGGDEFAVIMPDIAHRHDAVEVGDKIVAALSKQYYLDGHKRSVQVAASAGVAIFPVDAQDGDTVVEAAYTAMEKAKLAARN